jgi:hypothetical protein
VAGRIEPHEKLKEFSMGDLIPRQHGGVVLPNQAYLVGERGPEMFVPNVGSQIEPKKAGGGGNTINVSMVVHAADATSFQRSEAQITARLSHIIDRATRNK